jgi:hypothetical protein
VDRRPGWKRVSQPSRLILDPTYNPIHDYLVITGIRVSGSWGLGFGGWGLGLGAWGLGPGAWGLVPGAWGLGPRAWGLGSKIRKTFCTSIADMDLHGQF